MHLSKSIFCLAAAGWGWGGRMKVAVTRGCIPVIVQVGCDAVLGVLSWNGSGGRSPPGGGLEKEEG